MQRPFSSAPIALCLLLCALAACSDEDASIDTPDAATPALDMNTPAPQDAGMTVADSGDPDPDLSGDMGEPTDGGPTDIDEGVPDQGRPDVDMAPDMGTPVTPSSEPLAGDGRPAPILFPSDWDGSEALPLVVLLHGYSGNATQQNAYFRLGTLVESRRFVLVLPEGSTDFLGNPVLGRHARVL